MDQKRCKMAGFKILKTNEINIPDVNVVTELDKGTSRVMNSLTSNYGQFKSITVAKVDGKHLVVDGVKLFLQLKKNKVKKVLCYDLGKLSYDSAMILRVTFNIHQQRLDYLGIAEVISNISKTEKLTTIANRTGLSLEQVERYATLLDFDWDQFNKKEINNQINPFDYE